MVRFKQDDIVEVKIVGWGASGEGVARVDEYTFFVPFAIIGEVVRVKVVHVNKRGLVFCSLVEIIESSPFRVKPPCNRFMRCGGCDMMHITYEKQLEIKRENIINLLRKNSGIDFPVDEVVSCSTPLGYRNKIQLPIGEINGKVAVGFFKENTHKIVSITKCFLHGEWVEKLIEVFLKFANDKKLSVYNEVTKRGLLRHLVARYVGGVYCIVVVTNNGDLPYKGELVKRLTGEIGDSFSLYVSIKKKHDNVVLGESMTLVKEYGMEADILGIKSEINPYSFLQLNDEIRDKIYSRVVEGITSESADKSVVIDAYAGVGALGAVLAKRGVEVYNIEIVKEATVDGDNLSQKNGVADRVKNICGDAALVLPKLVKEVGNKKLSIILDPPRKGCDEKVLKTISELDCEFNLYYISCNPATLTRDLKILLANEKFKIEYITPYDMFPQTKHVETLVSIHTVSPVTQRI